MTGQSWTLRLEFVPDEVAGPAAVASNGSAAANVTPVRQQRAEIAQLPFVLKATEALGAQFVRADEGFGSVVQPPPTDPEEEEG